MSKTLEELGFKNSSLIDYVYHREEIEDGVGTLENIILYHDDFIYEHIVFETKSDNQVYYTNVLNSYELLNAIYLKAKELSYIE